jgi:DNA repair protein RadC
MYFADYSPTVPADAKQILKEVPDRDLYEEMRRRQHAHQGARRIAFPGDAMTHLRPYMTKTQEHFLVLLLDGQHAVIGRARVISKGIVNRCLVHPREVFRLAIKHNASGIITVHNHPSSSLEPSPDDREVCRRLCAAGEVVGIKVLDNLIISRVGYYSFLEHDILGI